MYTITIKNNTTAIVRNADGKETAIPIRHGDTNIPASLSAGIKKQGKDPANYFCVAGQYLMEVSFLTEWTEMVHSVIAKRKAETAAKIAAEQKIIETTARPVLLLWGPYYTKASVLYIENGTPVGDWHHVSRDVAGDFVIGKNGDGTLSIGSENGFFYLTVEEFDSLVAKTKAEEKARFETKAVKEEAVKVEVEKKQAVAIATAMETGKPVEISRYTVPCDGSVCECSFDLILDFIRGDGSVFSTRTHCH